MKIGTKSIIVKNGKVLLIRRSNYDSYMAGKWDIPGGRIEEDEGVFEGHKREVLEETKLIIKILEAVRVWDVQRPDGPHVGVTFLSNHVSGEVVLSNEHTEHKWLSPEEVYSLDAPEWIKDEVKKANLINPGLFAKDL